MSISEKLTTVAENVPKVYEAGQKSIFERIQDGGNTQNYYYAFAYDRFDDANFCPVYPIKFSNGITPGRYVFYEATGITDTKVEIVANSNNMDYCFFGCSNLATIRKLTVYETTTLKNTFKSCQNLKNITFGGTIGQDISFPDSPLSIESIKNIMNVLSEISTDKTATFKLTAVNTAFETSEGANDGSSSEEWQALVESKPNWKIELV